MPEQQHPFIKLFDSIVALRIDSAAKFVLLVLARHGRWDTGDNCAPSIARLAAETGLSERMVKYTLRSLACDSAAACAADEGRCQHYGLIIETRPSGRRSPTTYRISSAVRGTQPMLPEFVYPRAADPYAKVVQRSYVGVHPRDALGG